MCLLLRSFRIHRDNESRENSTVTMATVEYCDVDKIEGFSLSRFLITK